METEEPSKPGRGFLLALGTVSILVGALVAAELAVPLQPRLGGGSIIVTGGTVVMPSGVGSNLQLNFDPPLITVLIGINNTVTFQNLDNVKHTVTATNNAFDSGDILPGQKWTYSFSTPGNFSYYCIYHSGWMKGKVVVKQGTAAGGFTVRIPAGTGSTTTLNYSPNKILLVVGVNNTVTFLNQDSTKHTVTALDGSFDSGDMLPGLTWSHTFSVGTYSFHCIYHSWMTGSITVKSA